MGRAKGPSTKRLATIPLDSFHKSVDGHPSKSVKTADSNPFGILESIADDEIEVNTYTQRAKKVSSAKPPPPITVASNNVADVHKKIIASGIVRYTTNVTIKGIVVRTDSIDNYKKLLSHFKKINLSFHSYQLEEDKTTKIVLLGLLDMPIENLRKILLEEKLTPVAIKKLAMKQKRNDEQAAYLLHFSKGTVELKVLRTINALDHQKVSWKYYSNKSGVMQCKNCQSFGHGGDNCFRQPKCIKCGETHTSSSCPLAKECADGIIPTHKLKCANCTGNHTANYTGCPIRKKFETTQASRRTTTHQTRQVTLSHNNFPLLINPNSSQSQNHRTDKTYNPNTRIPQSASYADITKTGQKDLFGPDELALIITETFSNLRNCSSKEDQIMVVFKIVQKFCFP